MTDLKLTAKDTKSISKEELEGKIKDHLKNLFIYIMKRGLDKGFEEPNTEFVFYKKSPVEKRAWKE